MIPTRDRCLELAVTCEKILQLRPPPDEVLIFADGCVDETVEMLRTRFPGFRLLRSACPVGSVAARDQMLRAAIGDIVLSLDDDSYPVQPDFLARLHRVFDAHPEAAVVVFPEVRDGNRAAAADKSQKSPGHYVSAYANCAAAMRRAFYVEQPGFMKFFGHMYEEPDYALQCYAAGAGVWFEPSLSVRHHQSRTNRSPMRRHHLNARNELWSVWLRCPLPLLALISVYRVARQFLYACSESPGWAACEPFWWAAALRGLRICWKARRPVDRATYLYWLRLARRPIYSL